MKYDDAQRQIEKRHAMTETVLVTRAKGSGLPLRFNVKPTDLMELQRPAGGSRTFNDQGGTLHLTYTKKSDGSTWNADIPLDQIMDIEVKDLRIHMPAGVRQ